MVIPGSQLLIYPVLWILMPAEESVAPPYQPSTDTSLDRASMHATASRSAHADQLEAEVRDAHCCVDLARCSDCRAKLDEVLALLVETR